MRGGEKEVWRVTITYVFSVGLAIDCFVCLCLQYFPFHENFDCYVCLRDATHGTASEAEAAGVCLRATAPSLGVGVLSLGQGGSF